ncbi:hypothetical protein GUJ93_ZPchr0002g25059 [Zizania palustris]|uniref:BHLH domain-containing protein n=1 Tax=Zizania palustris TaxID=103762 RepID=A0A8J5V4U9_ZIZPA|nr:hypothetical protein GUJ93_ZPchr0002g25059 [Zizania palustris]
MPLFQGEKPSHDFLSLRAGGSSPSPSTFQPLELAKQRGRSNGNTAAGNAVDGASPAGSDSVSVSEEHVLPGGVGTFSIKQASGAPSREEAGSHGAVRGAFGPVLHGSRMENAHETGSGGRAHRAPSNMWQDSGIDQRSLATGAEGSSTSDADQGPSTPRSKHSATEQRRRTKINDRFEILRELLPHGDQKRDKASFLSEVIEHIRFLQEKVQKYETADPEWNHEGSKSMPWAKVYYGSCWRNPQNSSQVQGGELSPSTYDMNKEQYGSKPISVAPPAPFNTQSITSTTASSSQATGTPQNWTKNSTPSNQPPWLSMSTMNKESESGNIMLHKNKRQTVHRDNHSLSSAYSQGLFNRLTEALKKSGVDPSQANISVEINMGKREREDTSDNSKVNEAEKPIHITKRSQCDKSRIVVPN